MEGKRLLEEFFDAYLVRRDLESSMALVSDQVMSVGTGVQEIARNKAELRELLEREFLMMGAPMKYEIQEYYQTEYGKGLVGVLCHMTVYAVAGAHEGVVLDTRLTAVLAEEDGQWKFVNFHMSVPERSQGEGEFFPLKYGHRSVGTISGQAGRKLVEMLLTMVPGGIMGGYLEKGFPLYVINDTMLRYLGYTYEELVQQTDEEMIRIIAPEDREWVEREILDSVKDRGEYEVQYRVVRKDGTYMWMLDKGNEVITEDGRRAIISVMLDISKNMCIQEQLRKESMEDGLTKILNRRGGIHFIKKSFAEKDTGTLMLLDIDNFKSLNDTYGHLAGDEVLVSLADILKRSTRKGDVVSRMGGDEFLVYLSGCTKKEIVRERVESIGRQFLEAGRKYELSRVSVSTGIAAREQGERFEELYQKADRAMYLAKKQKKGGYAFASDGEETGRLL